MPYLDGSYALLVGHYIKELGRSCIYVDPLCCEMPSSDFSLGGIVLMCHETMYRDYSLDSVIIDPWRKVKKDPKYLIIPYGNTR